MSVQQKIMACCIFILMWTSISIVQPLFCEEDLLTRLNNLNKYLNEKKVSVAGFSYNARGKRDPFVPLVGIEQFLKNTKGLTDQERESLPSLPSITEMKNLFPFILTGIVQSSDGKSLAIINGKILEKGDEVDGAKVVEIKQDSVKLLWKKKTILLSLKEEKSIK